MTEWSRQVHLRRRPNGSVELDHFEVVEVALPELRPDEILVDNLTLSVDPYMRPRMDDVPSYVPPFRLHAPLDGGAVGRVVKSADPAVRVGSMVLHMAGWRDRAVLRSSAAQILDLDGFPPSYFLGVLGMPGLTAYSGLVDVAGLRPDESVFVSAAAGAVGGLAGQFARLLGAKVVIGSAGTDDKVNYITQELGFDRAFNYRSAPVLESLRNAAPQGIDVYFDNVGGDHLSAALEVMRPFGRVAMCGTISSYQSINKVIPGNLFQIVAKRVRLQGLLVTDHRSLQKVFYNSVASWLRAGAVEVRETTWHGIENVPTAFLGLLGGRNTGKVVIELSGPG